jgi:hypothetical protein
MGTWACCASAASGHTAAPPISEMKSRRLMSLPKARQRQPITSKKSFVHHSKTTRPMSAMGHKRTFRPFRPMSALPPKAGSAGCREYVRFCANSRYRTEIRSGNFNDRAWRPRNNALAIAADTPPPLIPPSYTIPEPSLVLPGDCAVGPPSMDHLGEIR